MFKWLSNLFGKKPVIVEELEPPKVFNTIDVPKPSAPSDHYYTMKDGWVPAKAADIKFEVQPAKFVDPVTTTVEVDVPHDEPVHVISSNTPGVSVVKTETETIVSVPIKKARKPKKKAEQKVKKKKS